MSDLTKTPEVKPERESGSFEGARSVANAKRSKRKQRGIVFLLLGLFAVFCFISIASEVGSDPSGALIFFISAPLAVLGGICILVGIVMILSGLGAKDSRSLEHIAEAPDSNAEKNAPDSKPDHETVDLGARHFVKQTTSFAAAYVVAWVVVVPLLVILTFKVFGRLLFEVFFR